jgi:hypothetical protein
MIMTKTIRILTAGLLTLVMLGMVGCGTEFSADKDTVYVPKKGSILGANVAEFDKDYYVENELSKFISDTVDTYVEKAGEGSVEIRDFAVEDQMAHVYLSYASAEDYADFNKVEFYAGTVLDAKAAGYDIPDNFTAVTDKDTTWDADGNKIVIIGQEITVRVDGTILFVSDNATAVSGNEADVTYDLLDESAQPAYIIYK